MNGVYWKFELKGRWRLKHINVTEGMGPIGNIMCFGPTTATANEQLVTGVDNTSALSMVRGTAKADDLVFQGECLRETEEYSEAEANTWLEHEGGYGNIITVERHVAGAPFHLWGVRHYAARDKAALLIPQARRQGLERHV